MDYLQVCLKRYNKHEDLEERKAIVRAIQGMMFKVSPQETEKFARTNMTVMQRYYQEILEKAIAYSRAKDADKVIETLEPVITKLETENVYVDDDKQEYVAFCIETTGFSIKRNKIIEIEAVRINSKGREIGRCWHETICHTFKYIYDVDSSD